MKTVNQIKKKKVRRWYVMLFGSLIPKHEYMKHVQESKL